ncbi:hypothetical protein F3087_31785 [Nocardia colli]|uniref:Uncharacterized protein n=1 Tax=Nocardia colli TaxID=2545717 RepID=A0A5N0E686_9NOCA|nr:hypothetical protein [Nocardia colli]KAA8884947.1 hypothetical protein F3087_31785 [Nocardia colli]
MKDRRPPKELDGATVVVSALTRDTSATGVTQHSAIGDPGADVAGLAIARYAGTTGEFYLFYCDEDWVVLTDTWHATIDDAIAQADREFNGVRFEPV